MGYTTPSSLEEGSRQQRNSIVPISTSTINLHAQPSPSPAAFNHSLPLAPGMSLSPDPFLLVLIKSLPAQNSLKPPTANTESDFLPSENTFRKIFPGLFPKHALHTVCASVKMGFFHTKYGAHQATPLPGTSFPTHSAHEIPSGHGSCVTPSTKPFTSRQAWAV